MPLVDTSVWVSHLRDGDAHLAHLLDAGEVWTHPFVIGELSCGHLQNRKEILELLRQLPVAAVASHDETLQLIEGQELWGAGLGYVDVHLVAAALITGLGLWTLDKSLGRTAQRIGCGYDGLS